MTLDEEQAAFTNYLASYKQFILWLGKEFPEVYLENCVSGGIRALETWISIRSIEKFAPMYNGTYAEKIIMSGDAS